MNPVSITDIKSLRSAMRGRIGAPSKAVPSGDDMVIDVLRSPAFAEEVKRCVPAKVTYDVDRLLRIVQTQVRSDPKLASAEPRSILGAVMECAEMGLMPGFMGHCYITAALKSQQTVGFQYEAQVIPGYRGLIALAMRSGKIKSISSRVVTDTEIEQGLFELFYEGDRDVLMHKPILLGEKGTPALVYCLVRFDDGSFHVEPMTADEVNRIKSQAIVNHNGVEESAWITHEMEMWRKTPIRRAMKYLNISLDDLSRAMELEEKSFRGESQELHRRYGDESDDAIAAAKASAQGNSPTANDTAPDGDGVTKSDNVGPTPDADSPSTGTE